jgi:CheY-like chemotaxis protein
MKLNFSPIFVVDDDPDDRLIINNAICQKLPDTEIREFSNGQHLLEALQELNALEHPAMIIVDLNMPGKDGRSAVSDIKNNPALRLIPVIVCTTSTSVRDKLSCYSAGANCFVSKPTTFEEYCRLFSTIVDLWLPYQQEN